MIVFAQMFEHTQKFIAFQPAELIEKNLSENACVIKGTLISAILKTNIVTQFFLHFLIGNGLKNVSTKFEQNRIGFENS